MGESRPASPEPRSDLNTFDAAEAEESRRASTSPRSLGSCARLGVNPVELLIKSLREFIPDHHGTPFEAVTLMHQSYEQERGRLLQLCLRERERIIGESEDRRLGGSKLLALEDGGAGAERRGSLPDFDRGFKRKSVSTSSSSLAQRDRRRRRPESLADLRHSPATELQLERLTRDVEKEMSTTITERDRKIAALMLAKHQEEQARLKLCQQEEKERQEARRWEEAQQTEMEKQRRKKLKQSMQRWHDDMEARRRTREHKEKELVGLREQEMSLQEDRWRKLTEELEAQRREKIEAARREAEVRKCCQEKLLRVKEEMEKMEREKERQVAQERELKARRNKVTQERRERKRLQHENHRELLQHVHLKRQVEQQEEEEEALMRSALEKKLHNSWEKHALAMEARFRELQGRAAQKGEQIQRAQLRARLQSQQQLRQKEVLVQVSQCRMERAAQHTSAQGRVRAQQTRQHNQDRQLCHQQLRDRVEREEEAQRMVRESYIAMKECRRERLLRQREQIQEEARRLARASFHMRERVRERTRCRTFDQMALEAELANSIGRMKL
ncbi:coiled-coil domain-containing protein 177 [Lampris incognitus]|uniref:coiled-coil domain-containing protein 177 n=1 Tax=Lampris incognitus TaxID=2546036 RepID=UPI0024B52DB1|nr:coiled-coil domain-containing protein 177 [Lampris incognitus]